ncbi:MAG: M42 family metallopeptidase [Kiritimatiellaeota bacterium]|nr:M42 family metallopeptidase [Kiritimatiellota bacterium]
MDPSVLLKELSEAAGVSGYEHRVRELVLAAFEPVADEIRTDAMGNLIALKRGRGERSPGRIMLAGHMDEIGLIVTAREKGFLRFTQVGGFDIRTLPGQKVTVHGRRDLPGVIGCRPPHVVAPADRNRPVPMDQLFVDVGLSEAEIESLVRVGDLVTLRRPFTKLLNGRVCGKAFDDRVAVVAIAICLEALQDLRHTWDVYGVATVQEEVGLRGATTGTFGIAPDVGIAIDVGFAKQPGVSAPNQIEIDKGPALAFGPNIHPALFREIKQTANDLEIPVQVEVAPRGTGTDANAMQITREGIPTALLSIPERNMHTPIETLCMKDVTRTGRLLAHFIARMGDDFLDQLTWDRKRPPTGGSGPDDSP